MKHKILITGASGQLASYVISLINPAQNDLYGLITAGKCLLAERLTRVYNSLEALFAEHSHFDYVYHLAAYIPYKKENHPDRALVQNNIGLTYQLAEKYFRARWIYSSSVSVYGVPAERPLRIHSPIDRPNYYGESKLAGEIIIKNLPSYVIIRFSSLIGPGMKANTFIPVIIRQAKENKKIILYGDGSRLQNYLDYRDAARLVIHCAQREDNIFALGCALQSYSNYEIARIIQSILDVPVECIGEDPSVSFEYNLEGFFEQIGFQPQYDIVQTIREMIEHA